VPKITTFVTSASYGLLACITAVALTGKVVAQEALLERGIAEYQSGNQYAALQSLSTYVNANSRDFRGYFWRSQLFIRTSSNDNALNDLNRVIELSPENPDAHYLRGVVLMIKGERVNACRDLVRASELGQKMARGEVKKYCS